MNTTKPELLAAYWTLAGDVYPGAPTEVSPFSLQERAEAAAKAGWTGMGLVHADLQANVARMGHAGIRRVLEGSGIKHVEVEFLADWHLEPSDPRRQASDQVRRDLLESAAELGARNLKVCGAMFDENPPDIALMQEKFAHLCEQARTVGTNVVIEMMPFTNVRNIDDAVAIVAGADQPNGGLLIDIWHVARGGMDYGEIAKIPARFLKGVELDDAAAQTVGTLFEDTRFHRLLCGEGALDVPAFLAAIRAAGFDAPYYGVEIISETFRNLPLEVMARTAYESTAKQLDIASA